MTDAHIKARLDGPRLPPKGDRRVSHLVVFLHGYGADGDDVIGIGHAFQEVLPGALVVAPHAPEFLPFEALGGRQWFALTERSPNEYRLGAEAAQGALDTFIAAELAACGLASNRLVLAGFSQGAMMAFQSGLRSACPPAALLAFSGLLPGPDRVEALNTQTPVLLVHGADDEVVPAYHLESAHAALQGAGVQVEAHVLAGLGHGIDARGLDHATRFLEHNVCL